MEIIGKLIQKLEKISGTSARGDWSKQDFIIETFDEYPKKIHITNFGEKIPLAQLNEGEKIKVFVNIESREYNERWYTNVNAWKYEKLDAGDPAAAAAPAPEPTFEAESEDSTSDLPF